MAENKKKPIKTKKKSSKKRIRLFTLGGTDVTLVFAVMFLMAFGVIMVYSASYYESFADTGGESHLFYGLRQLQWAGLAIFVMMLTSFVNYKVIVKFWFPMYASTLVLLVMVLVMEGNKSGRWISFGPVNFQPSELSKLAIVLTLAMFLTKTRKHLGNFKVLLLNLVILAVPTFLTAMADLSTGIVTGLIGVAMIFVAIPKRKTVAKYIGIIVLGGAAFFVVLRDFALRFLGGVLKDYQNARIKVFLDGPWSDPAKSGYQTIQSLYAIGSGGLFGKGLGYSMQKNGFIPEAHNDIIFAIICEELGLFGAMAVMSLYAIILWRCYVISTDLKDIMGVLIVAGIMTQVGAQMIINISVVTNKMPATGMPLPFISYGGSSLLFLAVSLGIVLNIARQRDFGVEK